MRRASQAVDATGRVSVMSVDVKERWTLLKALRGFSPRSKTPEPMTPEPVAEPASTVAQRPTGPTGRRVVVPAPLVLGLGALALGARLARRR
ncbi:MAG TPA: hypothetical protein VM370_08300 [Candidatus Thermoplasmatota archaeon]|nr:hypothetical protein [Candidatus Thermoplasmatota archaeon]